MDDTPDATSPVEEQIPTGETPDYSTLSPTELRKLTREALEAPPQEELPPEAEPEAATPAEDAPPSDPDLDDEAPANPKGKQIRLKGADLTFAGLRKQGVSVKEATRLAYPEEFAADAEKPAEPAAAAEPAPEVETVAAIDAKLASLRVERREETASLNFERQAELTDEIESLIERKNEVREAEKERAQQVQQSTADVYQQNLDAVLAAYPDYADDNSERSKRASIIRQTLEATANPIIDAPNYPQALHEMVEASFKTVPAPTQAAPPPPAKAPVKAAPLPQAQPLAGRPAQPAQPMTLEEWDSLSPGDRTRLTRALLGRK